MLLNYELRITNYESGIERVIDFMGDKNLI